MDGTISLQFDNLYDAFGQYSEYVCNVDVLVMRSVSVTSNCDTNFLNLTYIPSLDSLLCSGDLEKEIKPFDVLSDLDYSDIKSTSESPDGHNTYFDRTQISIFSPSF